MRRVSAKKIKSSTLQLREQEQAQKTKEPGKFDLAGAENPLGVL